MKKALVNSYGNRRRIHLYHHPRKTIKRGVVHEYSLATCYYEDGKNKKKILQSLGELTDDQADQYRFLLKGLNGQVDVSGLCDIESVIFSEEKHYLDVLALDLLWKRFGLDKIFDSEVSGTKRLSTEHIARILTINKLLSPSSKIKTIPWFNSTLLAKIMGVEKDAYERNKIFRELAEIHKRKNDLERAFWRYSQKFQKKYDAYYFDGSTSWFEGSHCPLAEADLEKTRGFFPKVLGIMLVTDNRGFPVAWEVVNGHRKDTTEIKSFVQRINSEYEINEITYCFDRGVASVNNFELIADNDSKFISAIRDNQIKDVLDLKKFEITRARITTQFAGQEDALPATDGAEVTIARRKIVGIDGYLSFDENLFFKDLGVIRGKRYVMSFNFQLFTEEDKNRQRRIDKTLFDINEKNIDLGRAKKDRDFNITERELLALFSKHKVREYFEYKLLPLTVKNKVQSFKIECHLNLEKIHEAGLTDGILIYISDHIEMREKSKEFKLSARDIVAHYKGKYVVENAFRELKSFLDLRPFYVWTEAHVKAHFDICIIGCFINNYIETKLRAQNVSLREFYDSLAKVARAVKIESPKKVSIFKLKPISDEIKRLLDGLGIPEAYSPSLHRLHGIFQ